MDARATFVIPDYQFSSSSFDARAICLALSQVATAHAAELGILKGFDPARDCGWVIVSIRLRVLQVPKPNQNLTLETWVSAIEGASLIREYRIRASETDGGATFVEAAQSFVLFDRDTRKPVLAPLEKRKLLKGGDRTHRFRVELDRRTSRDDFQNRKPDHETTHVVTPDEVDHNNHLNHGEYLKWLADHLKCESTSGEFAIEYLREARVGDDLKIQSWRSEGCTTIFFVDETTAELSAIARHI